MKHFFIPPGIYYIKNLGTGWYITSEANADSKPGSPVFTYENSKWITEYGKFRVYPRHGQHGDYTFQSVSNGLFVNAPFEFSHSGTESPPQSPAIWSDRPGNWTVESANTSSGQATPGAATLTSNGFYAYNKGLSGEFGRTGTIITQRREGSAAETWQFIAAGEDDTA
ncbi:hypothetical protein L218DRAFT_1059080 [Marasmius fiardii PR-910]|nr:hypothetical protein L218DRAFT_1059080 [Marasmius fiardii PR-910]